MKSEVFLQQKIKLDFPVFLILFFMTGLQKYNPVSTQFLFGISFMENFFYKVREKNLQIKCSWSFYLHEMIKMGSHSLSLKTYVLQRKKLREL